MSRATTQEGDMNEEYRRIEVTVAVWIKEDADPSDVVSEMDYHMTHPDIVDTEVVDINTEV
jgi:hypothetical protein